MAGAGLPQLLPLRRTAGLRSGARRGPRPAPLHRLRLRDLRQPAPRGHHAAGHRLRASSCSCGAPSRRASAPGPSRAGSWRLTRPSSRGPSARRWRRPASIVEPDRIVGIYSRPQAAIVVIAYQATIVGGAMTVTRESLEVRSFRVEAIPWAGLAFCTTLWAVRDWVRAVRPDLDVGRLLRWAAGGLTRPEPGERLRRRRARRRSHSQGGDVRERSQTADERCPPPAPCRPAWAASAPRRGRSRPPAAQPRPWPGSAAGGRGRGRGPTTMGFISAPRPCRATMTRNDR